MTLIDYRDRGHHPLYQEAVAEAYRRSGMEPTLTMVASSGRKGKEAFGETMQAVGDAMADDELPHHLYLDWMVIEAWKHRACLDGSPWMATLHVAHPLTGGFGPRSLIRQWRERRALLGLMRDHGLHLIVHGKWVAKRLERMGVGDRVQYVPYPVSNLDVEPTLPFAPDLASDAAIRVLVVGGLRPDKGIKLTIDAVKRIPDAHLVIAGWPLGLKEETIQSWIQHPRLAGRVTRVPGYLSDGDLIGLIDWADVLSLPYDTKFAGQSGPLLLAAARGTPSVVSEAPTMAETVREYGVGVVVERGTKHLASGFCDAVRQQSDGVTMVAEHSADDYRRTFRRR